jgi:hypothetical protein
MILAHMTFWVVELKRFWIFEIFNHCVLFIVTKKLDGWPSIIGPLAKQCTEAPNYTTTHRNKNVNGR